MPEYYEKIRRLTETGTSNLGHDKVGRNLEGDVSS
jgi:hypothetical protein